MRQLNDRCLCVRWAILITLALLYVYASYVPCQSTRRYVDFAVTPSRSPASVERRKLRSHIQRITGIFRSTTMEHGVLDSFIAEGEKCRNCLPNYFTKSKKEDKSEYRSGIAVFLLHLKSGATTMHRCFLRLLAPPKQWPNKLFAKIFNIDHRLTWKYNLSEFDRAKYKYLDGPSVMGLCDDVDVTVKACSYYMLLRDPIERAVSSYFYCKYKPTDELCATRQMNASSVDVKKWAIHQRSFLFIQLTFDIRYCNLSKEQQREQFPCWYRQRILMEQTDLQPTLEFLLNDLVNRFAVIGMLESFEESMTMFTQVYGINFTKCVEKQENVIAELISDPSYRKLQQQVNDRDTMVSQLRKDKEVMHAFRYDIAIYRKAHEIFEQQRQAIATAKT